MTSSSWIRLHLLDCPLACGNRVGLNFLNLYTEASDLVLQSLFGRINFNHLGLLFPKKTLKVTSISTSLISTVVSKLKFLGNILVISGDSSKLLLNFDLELAKAVVGRCKVCNLFVESSHLTFVILDNLQGVVVSYSQALKFCFNGCQSLDGNVILLN